VERKHKFKKDRLMIEQIISHYKILEKIDAGEMGIVGFSARVAENFLFYNYQNQEKK
jgi:hypothetical protein